jgi:hypothetical protein
MLTVFKKVSCNYTTTDKKYNHLKNTLKIYQNHLDHTTALLNYILSVVIIESPSISDRCIHMISACNLFLIRGFFIIWELPDGVNIIEQLKLILNSRINNFNDVDAIPIITHLEALKQILINIIYPLTYEANIAYENYMLAETEFNTFCEANQEQLQIAMNPRISSSLCKKIKN